jgi:ribosomal protein S18 acetylase RimI-like enzyme
MEYIIREISVFDIQKVIDFADKWIAKNHFKRMQLRDFLMKGIREDINASFLALDNEKVIGLRLTFAPGEWINEDHELTLSPHLWHIDKDSVAYLKSLFIDKEYQGMGIGKILSEKSISAVKAMGAKGIVCHSWVESPRNLSRKYLDKMNFKAINLHENFWSFKDHTCAKCTPRQCECSACEMLHIF